MRIFWVLKDLHRHNYSPDEKKTDFSNTTTMHSNSQQPKLQSKSLPMKLFESICKAFDGNGPNIGA